MKSPIIVLLLIAMFVSFAPQTEVSTVQALSLNYSAIIDSVNMTAVEQHIRFFSSLETRAAGYLGSETAAQYIYDTFLAYGLENVSFQEFPLPEAFSYGANLTVLATGEHIDIYPCKPNLVVPSTTPPEGVTGRLVYVGDGFLSDYDGIEVEGSIVVMNWYGEENWLVAAKLGAQAVIFIPPGEVFPTGYYTTEEGKNVDVPVQFPRFYASDTTFLFAHINETVRVKANTRWTTLTGKNVLGFVEGENPNVIILLSAYYDSGGYVPSFAPGAQESCGVAALLEIARYLQDNQPKYTVMFAAFSAHHQALLGATEFASDYIRGMDIEKRGIRANLFYWYNLDFSTGFDAITLVHVTSLHNNYAGEPQDMLYNPILAYLQEVLDSINQEKPEGRTYEGIIVDKYGPSWFNLPSFLNKMADHSSYTLFLFETDAAYWLMPFSYGPPTIIDGVLGHTFTTAYDPRPYYGTPFDTFDTVNFANLQKQLEIIYCLLSSMLYMEDLEERFVDPLNLKNKVDPDEIGHWFSVSGEIGYWNRTKNWYSPISDAVVLVTLPNSPMTYRVAFTDENGIYNIRGGLASSLENQYSLTAYKIDPSTGAIIYAPDQGRHEYTPVRWRAEMPFQGRFVVFEAATVVIFDSYDPGTLSSTQRGGSGLTYSIIDSETFGAPDSWGYLGTTQGKSYKFKARAVYSDKTFYSTSVFAVPSEESFLLTAQFLGDRYPTMFLSNSSEDYSAVSYGFTLEVGQQLLVPLTSLRYAESFCWTIKELYAKLIAVSSLETKSPEYQDYLRVDSLINEAYDALDSFEYLKAFSLGAEAWSVSQHVYSYLRFKLEDAASVVPFFAFLLIPFIFLVERLLFDYEGLKRLIVYIAVFAGGLTALYLLHPGFTFPANPLMMVIAASSTILLLPMLLIVFSKAASYVKVLRVKLLGKHSAEVSRGSEIMCSFSVGIRNMRRRRLRSTLTVLSMILMIGAMVSFTSISSYKKTAALRTFGNPLYEGIYIHKYQWGTGNPDLGRPILDYLKAKYGELAKIAPRAWKYTLWPTVVDIYTKGFKMTLNGNTVRASVLWGLTVEEKDVSYADILLDAGRWFIDTDHRTCILNGDQAESLGIDPEGLPVKVAIEGQDFTVIGIMDDIYFSMRDLDAEEITPIKLDITENEYVEHVTKDEVFILQFDDVCQMFGGDIASISMKFEDGGMVSSAVSEIQETLDQILLWSCVGDVTSMYASPLQVTVLGLEYQAVPILIVALSIFNLSIASVYERRREISTLATVGLSPRNISFIFLTEAIVCSVVGGVTGYLAGMFACSTLATLMPGTLSLNFSSSWVMISVVSAMGVALLSSIVPFYQASKLVTPSLKRAFEITTNPIGNSWEIPLPFHVDTEEELHGVISYLAEYLESHEGEHAPEFITKNIRLETEAVQDQPVVSLIMTVSISPYDLGVIQDMSIKSTQDEGHWNFRLVIMRKAGEIADWVRLNRRFVGVLRGQMLLWRILAIDEKSKYSLMFDELQARLSGK